MLKSRLQFLDQTSTASISLRPVCVTEEVQVLFFYSILHTNHNPPSLPCSHLLHLPLLSLPSLNPILPLREGKKTSQQSLAGPRPSPLNQSTSPGGMNGSTSGREKQDTIRRKVFLTQALATERREVRAALPREPQI